MVVDAGLACGRLDGLLDQMDEVGRAQLAQRLQRLGARLDGRVQLVLVDSAAGSVAMLLASQVYAHTQAPPGMRPWLNSIGAARTGHECRGTRAGPAVWRGERARARVSGKEGGRAVSAGGGGRGECCVCVCVCVSGFVWSSLEMFHVPSGELRAAAAGVVWWPGVPSARRATGTYCQAEHSLRRAPRHFTSHASHGSRNLQPSRRAAPNLQLQSASPMLLFPGELRTGSC
jgi:hypothetical protein